MHTGPPVAWQTRPVVHADVVAHTVQPFAVAWQVSMLPAGPHRCPPKGVHIFVQHEPPLHTPLVQLVVVIIGQPLSFPQNSASVADAQAMTPRVHAFTQHAPLAQGPVGQVIVADW
jgi:hypothetical protein